MCAWWMAEFHVVLHDPSLPHNMIDVKKGGFLEILIF